VDLHDDAVMEKLVFSSALLVSSRLRCHPLASAVDSALPLPHQDPSQPGAGGKGNDARACEDSIESSPEGCLESIEVSSQRFLHFLDALLQGLSACLSVPLAVSLALSLSLSRFLSLSLSLSLSRSRSLSRSLALVRGARPLIVHLYPLSLCVSAYHYKHILVSFREAARARGRHVHEVGTG
jgi:hypothetical protein